MTDVAVKEDFEEDWWATWEAVRFVADYLAGQGASGRKVLDLIDAPWEFTDEYERAINMCVNWWMLDSEPETPDPT